jgi:aminoglycoside phosphotransferase (APT) family kinase protein
VPFLPRLRDETHLLSGWQDVAADPGPFLSLGLATESWLHTALPSLQRIDAPAVVAGDALLHNDVRSDNICFRLGRALFVDWNLACVGHPDWDLAFWLPSLQAEGGPPPEVLLPDAGALAGIISGFFASRAGLPTIPDAPRVRHIQRVQLRTALPWAVRALGLPSLDGLIV